MDHKLKDSKECVVFVPWWTSVATFIIIITINVQTSMQGIKYI